MRLRNAALPGVAALALALASCSDGGITSPGPTVDALPRFSAAAAPPAAWISELHYDNAGTDAGEFVEVMGPAGTSLEGWSVVLYNGSNGALYGARALSGSIPATCGASGVVVLDYPSNGIQNGAPDGVALVDASGVVVDLLAYEGSFPAAGGPADGRVLPDIGVSQSGSQAGTSLQRGSDGGWLPEATGVTKGACNGGPPVVAGPVASVVVTPAAQSVAAGASATFSADGYDAGGNPSATTFAWSSADPAIATIDPATGVATGVAAGQVTITARSANDVAGTAVLTVTAAPHGGEVWISELHYDNAGTDAGEAVEVEGPAGTDLTGWSIVLYNGNGGGTYDSAALSGSIRATCGARGVVSVAIAGIQNGAPDGLALVDADGAVVEFLSYEGTITATDGPAQESTSTDLGVSQSGGADSPASLQRDAAGVWSAAATASFGACNGTTPPPPPPPGAGIVIHEFLGAPVSAESASWGEWFEVHNTGASAVDLNGWAIASGGQAEHVIGGSVVVQPGGYAVLGRGGDPGRNGGVTLDYNYFAGSATLWLDANDWLALRDGAGVTVDSVRWTGTPDGVSRAVRDASVENANVEGGTWGYSTVRFGAGDYGTPGAANGALSATPPGPPAGSLSFAGRDAGDPPLPVGFQDQIFANGANGTVTWSSETPSLATIDQNGVVTATGVGTVLIRATTSSGQSGSYSLATTAGTSSSGADYGHNTEFGVPADGTPEDDFLVVRREFTSSYDRGRGTPNWVSYNIDPTHFGPADRCDCFTPEPELPGDYPVISTADYTGSGGYHGYGIDRGHLARSADRTAASLDNAATYYFSNIIPQAADNNQGPWASFENAIGDRARGGAEVYVVTGVYGSRGTLKDEGKIVIPESVWKVAVVMPRDRGLDDVDSAGDLEVIAIDIPNVPGIRDHAWESYLTTVDEIEARSGYDLLDLLPDAIERQVESDNSAPVADAGGPYTGTEGAEVSFTGAGSSDPDGDALVFTWSFGDGASGTGANPAHAYRDNGNYSVTLTVTDPHGGTSTITTSVMVVNLDPVVSGPEGATLLPGESYSAGGSFTDAGADDAWTATVDYGDGTGVQPLALDAKSFSLEHSYAAAGSYTVTVTVADDDGGAGVATATVEVTTPRQALAGLAKTFASMVPASEAKWIRNKLELASILVEKRLYGPAVLQLLQVGGRVAQLVRSGELSPQEAAQLQAELQGIVRSLQS